MCAEELISTFVNFTNRMEVKLQFPTWRKTSPPVHRNRGIVLEENIPDLNINFHFKGDFTLEDEHRFHSVRTEGAQLLVQHW